EPIQGIKRLQVYSRAVAQKLARKSSMSVRLADSFRSYTITYKAFWNLVMRIAFEVY
ncbi:hypothetical protein AVDCRST_MAG84-5168, partial [uncultured Microcoleus sp.]